MPLKRSYCRSKKKKSREHIKLCKYYGFLKKSLKRKSSRKRSSKKKY